MGRSFPHRPVCQFGKGAEHPPGRTSRSESVEGDAEQRHLAAPRAADPPALREAADSPAALKPKSAGTGE